MMDDVKCNINVTRIIQKVAYDLRNTPRIWNYKLILWQFCINIDSKVVSMLYEIRLWVLEN